MTSKDVQVRIGRIMAALHGAGLPSEKALKLATQAFQIAHQPNQEGCPYCGQMVDLTLKMKFKTHKDREGERCITSGVYAYEDAEDDGESRVEMVRL